MEGIYFDTKFWSDVASNLFMLAISSFGAVAVGYLFNGLRKALMFLDGKIDHSKFESTYAILKDLVATEVDNAEATVVKELKAKNGQKLTPADAKAVASLVCEGVLSHLKDDKKAILHAAYDDLSGLVGKMVERRVLEKKSYTFQVNKDS